MDWTSDEGYGMPIGPHGHMSARTEVSLMSFTLHLSSSTRKQRYRRLQQAYARGALRLVRRLHALLALAENMSVHDVAEMVALGQKLCALIAISAWLFLPNPRKCQMSLA